MLPASQILFFFLTVCVYGILLKVLNAAAITSSEEKTRFIKTLTLALVGWAAISGALAYTGFISDFSSLPPRFAIIVIVPLAGTVFLLTRTVFKKLLRAIAPEHLLYLQGFRVAVEILLWMLFIGEVIPVQMTFEGRNFDILVGITGPVVGWLYKQGKISKTIVSIWNMVGMALLINIVAVAMLSAPTPFRMFMNEPANTIVTTFPVVWLPALLVPLAYALHVMSWMQMSFLKKDATLPKALA